MKRDKKAQLLQELEQLPTPQLRELLHTELKNGRPDGDRVRMLLQVLEAREAAQPAKIGAQEQEAWEQFIRDCEEDRKRMASAAPAPKRKWVARVAAVAAAVCLLLVAIPTVGGTDNVFNVIVQWSEKAISYFKNPDANAVYVFKTDNPALQLTYDAVAALGITEPVVPMWAPEGYELVEVKTTSTPTRTRVYSRLTNGEDKIIFTMELLGVEAPSNFAKDDIHTETIEHEGITYNVVSNDGSWMATWTTEKVMCSLAVDGQKDTLEKMIRSIYKGGN